MKTNPGSVLRGKDAITATKSPECYVSSQEEDEVRTFSKKFWLVLEGF